MAELTIEGATIGIDTDHLARTLADIRNHCVIDAKNSLKNNLDNLKNQVRECWTGVSAETFFFNMNSDVNKLCDYLQKQYELLEAQFRTTLSEMREVDENLVSRR